MKNKFTLSDLLNNKEKQNKTVKITFFSWFLASTLVLFTLTQLSCAVQEGNPLFSGVPQPPPEIRQPVQRGHWGVCVDNTNEEEEEEEEVHRFYCSLSLSPFPFSLSFSLSRLVFFMLLFFPLFEDIKYLVFCECLKECLLIFYHICNNTSLHHLFSTCTGDDRTEHPHRRRGREGRRRRARRTRQRRRAISRCRDCSYVKPHLFIHSFSYA